MPAFAFESLFPQRTLNVHVVTPLVAVDRVASERRRAEELSKWVVHVNTLSAGSIVILATFAEKFHDRGPGWLLAIAAIGFAVAIAAGLLGYTSMTAVWHWGIDARIDQRMNFVEWCFFVEMIAFGVALSCFAVFAAFAVT